MEVVTGKVNLLEIEKDFIIPAEPESTTLEELPRHENYRNNNKSRKTAIFYFYIFTNKI